MNIFRFGADGTAYARGLNKMRGQAQKFGSSVKGIFQAAFAYVGITQVKSLAEEISSLGRMARRLGIDFEAFQTITNAARQFGVDAETAADAIKDLNVKIQDGARNGGAYAELFEQVGIDIQKIAKLSPEQQFYAFADAIAAAGTGLEQFGADEINDAMFQMVELLRLGGAGIVELGGQFKKWTVEQEEAAKRITIAWKNGFDELQKIIVTWGDVALTKFTSVIAGATQAAIEMGKVGSNAVQFLGAVGKGGFEFVKSGDAAKALGEFLVGGGADATTGIDQSIDRIKGAYRDAALEVGETWADRVGSTVGGVVGDIGRNATKLAKQGEQMLMVDEEREREKISKLGEAAQKSALNIANKLRKNKEAELKAAEGVQDATESVIAPTAPTAPSIITSALQSIGGGGGVAVFGNDPLLSENKRQTIVLEAIRDGLYGFNPITGETTSRPEL